MHADKNNLLIKFTFFEDDYKQCLKIKKCAMTRGDRAVLYSRLTQLCIWRHCKIEIP